MKTYEVLSLNNLYLTVKANELKHEGNFVVLKTDGKNTAVFNIQEIIYVREVEALTQTRENKL